MKIVFVHGRSQQGKDAEELRFSWIGALGEGFRHARLPWPSTAEFILPFYGDRLDRLVADVDSPLIGNILSRGETSVPAAESFRAEMLAEMIAAYPGLSQDHVAEDFIGEPTERGWQNWKWVLAMLRELDRTSMGSDAVDRFTRDVFVYLTFKGVRKQIDTIVAKDLNSGPCIVVAHSLGTVVAWNILFNRPASAGEIPLFITVGSPLGLDAVRTRIDGPLRMPPQVKRWFNARDPQDIVALFALDSDHFAIDPPIENDSTLVNGTDNRHGIDGYLDKAVIAERIHSAL